MLALRLYQEGAAWFRRVMLMVVKVFKIELDEKVKCGDCLWTTNTLFVLASSKKEAEKLAEECGLCGFCFAGFLAEEGYKIC